MARVCTKECGHAALHCTLRALGYGTMEVGPHVGWGWGETRGSHHASLFLSFVFVTLFCPGHVSRRNHFYWFCGEEVCRWPQRSVPPPTTTIWHGVRLL